MKSISIRFALTSVLVSLSILALTGSINYFFFKDELLHDATQKAKLIETNSVHKIQTIISKTKESVEDAKETLLEENFKKEFIKKELIDKLDSQPYFFGMAMAFEPSAIFVKPYSPYYYKKNRQIVYKDLANQNYNYLEKDWYKIAKNSKKESWSEPYFDKGGGETLMATYSSPIIQNGRFIGVLTMDLSLKELQEAITSIHILKSGYAFLLSKEYKILVDPDSSKIMTYYPNRFFEYNKMIKQNDIWIYYIHVDSTNLTLGIVLPQDELFSSLHKISLVYILLSIIGAILLIITMFIVSRKVTQPIKDITTLTHEISIGNFEKKIQLPKYHDEVFHLSLSINRMQDSIKRYIKDLKTATIKEQKIQSELNIAKSIQMSMLPKDFKSNAYFELNAFLKPAKAVGGDFYDFFYIEEDKLCFLIADVSGKGIPAALFMSVTMSYIRAYSNLETSAAKIVNKLNDTMASNNDNNMFVTLFLAILNTKNGQIEYVNAGHTQPYLLSSQKEEIQKLNASTNPVIGAFDDVKYEESYIKLLSGEKLFLYTDGVNEAYSKDDEQFGEERLRKLLKNNINLSTKNLIETVETKLKDFSKEVEQSDDITMFCLEYKIKETSYENTKNTFAT
jgi:sigma-B regulation protein RsbU (phosphoserine phosphatase)